MNRQFLLVLACFLAALLAGVFFGHRLEERDDVPAPWETNEPVPTEVGP